MTTIKPWKTLSSKMVVDNPWYQLRQDTVELPDGKVIDDYFVSVRKEIVFIFPVTKEQEVVMVEEYKHGIQKIITQLPAGVFDPKEETALEAAKRELKEETGYGTGQFTHLKTVYDDPSKNTCNVHVFLASEVEKEGPQQLDETENIQVKKFALAEFSSFLTNGRIADAYSIVAGFYALEHLKKIKFI